MSTEIKSIGTDPEVFIGETTDILVSSEGFFKGDKDDPEDLGDGYTLLKDNVAVEYTIPPCTTADEFVKHNNAMLNLINLRLPVPLKTIVKSSHFFDDEFLRTEHALKFGCDSEYSVYTQSVINPVDPKTTNLRSCGGHIHMGLDNKSPEYIIKVIKAFDLLVSLPITIKDPDRERRNLYGKAGSFRFKPYGAEARSCSNYWLNSEDLMLFVFNTTLKIPSFIESNPNYFDKGFDLHIQAALNEYNENSWDLLVNSNKLTLV